MSGGGAIKIHTLPSRVILLAFAGTLFFSAGLMFLVEPMVAKILLPRLGGSPAVWSTCLLFFQAVLLLGYGYAHALTRVFFRSRIQILVHFGLLLAVAAWSLPLTFGADAPPTHSLPVLWLLWHLAVAVGPAVFAVSATAPLLQSWFAGIEHEAADDPYFLYAASNAGSLLALIAYPFLVEPALSLDRQAVLWSCGFGVLAAGIALSGAAAATRPRARASVIQHLVEQGSFRDRLVWTGLAFVPSSMLLGVTTHITSDIASAPLFWVLPLGLYLITFILAFARRPPLPHALMIRVMPLALIPVAISMVPGLSMSLPLVLMLHLGCLFAVCMVCHGELAKRRPATNRLTEFYFFLSLGGVLGGVFNALIAPLIFTGVWEYQVALVAACLVKPATPQDRRRGHIGDFGLPIALLLVILAARRMFGLPTEGGHLPVLTAMFGFLLPGLALLNFSPRRWRFGFGIAACLFAGAVAGNGNTIYTGRSFFGVYRIEMVQDAGSRYLLMMHGTSLHGVRGLAPGEETVPMGYYSREGPFGSFFAALPAGSVQHVGAIGLGAGDLACYAQPGQDWTFFEIDPLVARIARDPRWFGFLDHCGNHPRVVLGDARLTIAAVPDGFYDVIILDAFSSDSIPMHLVTREALALYLRKLAPGGRLLFHISSRFLDLRPVLGALSRDAGLYARVFSYNLPAGASFWRHSSALVVAMARSKADLAGLREEDGWEPLQAGGARSLWTDQRSDLLSAIRFSPH